MNYTITLKDGDNLIVNQKQAEMAQKIKREGKGVININGEDIYAEHMRKHPYMNFELEADHE